jgi:hypothetical protein
MAETQRGAQRLACHALFVVDYVTLGTYGSGTKQKWVWGSGPASMPRIAAPARDFAFGAGLAASLRTEPRHLPGRSSLDGAVGATESARMSTKIQEYLKSARYCDQMAAMTADYPVSVTFVELARQWRELARQRRTLKKAGATRTDVATSDMRRTRGVQ